MGMARNAGKGGNNGSTKALQRSRSREQAGHGIWGWAGHHSFHKGHAKRNPAGATSHAPKEWSSHGRKEEERLTGLARQAELDAISEGLAEAWEEEFSHVYDEVGGDAALMDLPPGVTFNGQPSSFYMYDDNYECPCCGRRY